MNKKTFLATALLLGVSITLSVKYFPAVALAIKSGVIASAAPLVAFAVSVIIAAITLTVLAVFAIRSKDTKGKPNGVSGEPKSKNKEEGQILVQEEVAPAPTSPLPTQAGDGIVVNGDSAKQTDRSLSSSSCSLNGSSSSTSSQEFSLPKHTQSCTDLRSLGFDNEALCQIPRSVSLDNLSDYQVQSLNSLLYPSTSPLNTEKQNQLPPAPPSSIHGEPLENEQHQGHLSQSLSRSPSRNSLCSSNDEVAPAPTPQLLSPLQQPGDNLKKEMETPQPKKDDGVVVNGNSAAQQTTPKSLNSLLPEYPSMSPLDAEKQDQLPPAPPPDDSNPVQNHEQQDRIPIPAQIKIALPAFERGREVGQQIVLPAFECGRKVGQQNMLNALKPLLQQPSNSTDEENQGYDSLPMNQTMPYPNILCRSRSSYSLTEDVTHTDMIRDDFGSSSTLLSSMTDSSTARLQAYNSLNAESNSNNPQMPVPIYDVNNQGTNTSVVSQSNLSYGSLDNVKDVLDYRQRYYYDDNELSILESTIVEDDNESSILESIIVEESVSSDKKPQAPVVRSNVSTYDASKKIFDSINFCPSPTATPTPIVVEYDVHNGQNLNNNKEANQHCDDGNNYQGFYISADRMVNIPPNTTTSSDFSKESPCLNRENGPEERLLDVRLNTHSVVNGNSRGVTHGNFRSNSRI